VKRFFSKKLLLTSALLCGWLGASSWGTWRLAKYSLTDGPTGPAPARWPADTAVRRQAGGFTIVVALHPECSCSEATLEELDSIIAHSSGRVRAELLFVQLPTLEPVEDSALWQQAGRIVGVHATKDAAGVEARRFGARTSGETRLYAPDGALWFHGGITAARGHAGDNPGQAAIVSLVAGTKSPHPAIATPVFGCALWNDSISLSP
jgi:hypothetical protein